MDGAMIVGALLRAYQPLRAMVAPANVKLGELAENAPLPALLVRSVSLVDRQPLRLQSRVRSTERVAVTVRAATYRDKVAVMRLVRRCCPGECATVDGVADVANVSIRNAGLGPDVLGPGDSFERTIDFRVTYDGPA